jgi:CheY-like chemotaxis protein
MSDGECDRILVVDDDHEVREAIAEVLADYGYVITTASNGREALARLHAGERPKVILLDLMMPFMDGFQFRAVQKAQPDLSDIPVVVLTAHHDVSNVAARLGVAAGLRKPFELTTLLETLDRVCGPRPGSSASPS